LNISFIKLTNPSCMASLVELCINQGKDYEQVSHGLVFFGDNARE
jgi:hypothetical protein